MIVLVLLSLLAYGDLFYGKLEKKCARFLWVFVRNTDWIIRECCEMLSSCTYISDFFLHL